MNNLVKFGNELNPKIINRMLIFSNIYRKTTSSIYDDGMVIIGKLEPKTKDQEELLKTTNMFKYFCENNINKESIDKFMKEFNTCVDVDKYNYLLNFINSGFEETFEKACQLLEFVAKNRTFGHMSYKFTILVFNAILYKNNILPIIFYPANIINLFELVRAGLTYENLLEIIDLMFKKSVDYNVAHKLFTPDEIEEKLLKMKEELIQKFNVEHLIITGSFANGLFNKYSDLDLIVKCSDYTGIRDLEEFLKESLGLPVDCIRFNDKFTQNDDLVRYKIDIF